jgi:hypothetical protein
LGEEMGEEMGEERRRGFDGERRGF